MKRLYYIYKQFVFLVYRSLHIKKFTYQPNFENVLGDKTLGLEGEVYRQLTLRVFCGGEEGRAGQDWSHPATQLT